MGDVDLCMVRNNKGTRGAISSKAEEKGNKKKRKKAPVQQKTTKEIAECSPSIQLRRRTLMEKSQV
jgi:hypothetical protein